ncbi:zinc ribbon domain-containing protein [Mycolicibacterium sp. XJ1819]
MSGSGPAVPTTNCPGCRAEVPVAAFCGNCGARLARRDDDGTRLRLGAYAAAPGEHTLRLAVASSLLPHLPHSSRAPFRAGLAVLALALLTLALVRCQAALIVVGALGPPLIFALYLRESGVGRDLPIRSLALPAGVGVALGIGWAWVTGRIIAETHDVALGAAPSVEDTILGMVIPVGAAVLMLVPVVVMRLSRPDTREALDGYAIGAWGALVFTAAGTLTRSAPQFATGITDHDRPIGGLLVQAAIQGVALPLTAAALGGLVGAALWFGRPKLIVFGVLVTLGLYLAVGPLELSPLLEGMHAGVHLLIAVIALLALRFGLQVVLLGEVHEPTTEGAHARCPHCEHVIPDTEFCPNCGVSRRAAPPASPGTRPDRETEPAPGYALPADSYAAVPVRRTSYPRLLTVLGAGLAVAFAGGVTVAALATPEAPKYVCPPDCGRPPIAEPVESNPRFVSADGEFSVQYPGPGTAYNAILRPDGVELDFVGGDTGTMQLLGLPAEGRTPQQITDDLVKATYPNATVEYEIPNAMVGYEPGYGIVADEYPQDASGRFTRLRLVVMTAVKHDYALVAAAIGPYREFTRDFGTGHPSGANLQLAMDMGKYVNSFRWGDRLG